MIHLFTNQGHTMLKRTHTCGELRKPLAGEPVTLNGWVDSLRDMGALVFVDLRDRYGKTQVVFREEVDKAACGTAKSLRAEDVIAVQGTVKERDEKTVNPNMATGQIEVEATLLDVFSRSEVPPFEIKEETTAQEELRLKYRYLDLRRPSLQRHLIARHAITLAIRNYFHANGFLDIETPTLFRSSPEGARDYVVPSRVHPGTFYALPQSPQMLKQLLMVAGYDRYAQIVRCFRDEDLRAHRQPEFTQVDIEMSFVDEEDVMEVTEGMMATAMAVVGKSFEGPLARIPYPEAMDRFGSDAPDLRFGMEITDFSDIVKDCEFVVFRSALEKESGTVRGICVSPRGKYSRKILDGLAEFVKGFGPKGLLWLKVEEGKLSSSAGKHLDEGLLKAIAQKAGAEVGDVVLMVADEKGVALNALGRLRVKLANDEKLVSPRQNALCWVTKFPGFEKDEESGRYVACHHPFTAPMDEDLDYLESDPSKVRAKAYDLIWNGVEMGGGSIRIHDRDIQMRVFKALGFTEEQANEKFSFFMDAFKYGAPPHGGLAFGLDRVVMSCVNEDSIRNVIAFPKTTSAVCLMSQAPSRIDEQQLEELSLVVKEKGKKKP